MDVPFYRPIACRLGRHEMAMTQDPVIDRFGNVTWVRECAWCGAKETVVSPGEPRG